MNIIMKMKLILWERRQLWGDRSIKMKKTSSIDSTIKSINLKLELFLHMKLNWLELIDYGISFGYNIVHITM